MGVNEVKKQPIAEQLQSGKFQKQGPEQLTPEQINNKAEATCQLVERSNGQAVAGEVICEEVAGEAFSKQANSAVVNTLGGNWKKSLYEKVQKMDLQKLGVSQKELGEVLKGIVHQESATEFINLDSAEELKNFINEQSIYQNSKVEDKKFQGYEKGQEKLNIHELRNYSDIKRDEADLLRNKGESEVFIRALQKKASVADSEAYNMTTTEEERMKYMGLDDKLRGSLGNMNNSQFLYLNPEQRLQALCKQRYSMSDLQVGIAIDISFTFEGRFNKDLYMLTTAGQMLPETVGTVKKGGVEYLRKGKKGEFFNSTNERLKIGEGTQLEVTMVRLESKLLELEREREKYSSPAGKIAFEKGINTEVFSKVIGKDTELSSERLEEIATEFIRQLSRQEINLGSYSVESSKNNAKHKSTLASLYMYTHEQDVGGGNAWKKQAEDDFGIDTELLAGTGVGNEMIRFLKKRDFRAYSSRKDNCGRNVGMALIAFGIRGIPGGGRDGHKWDNFLEHNPNFKEFHGTPQDAPAGSIISYDKGTGGSDARQESGHVEIALGNNQGYYYGKKATRPGGSNKNFKSGTYRIFTPVSKHRK